MNNSSKKILIASIIWSSLLSWCNWSKKKETIETSQKDTIEVLQQEQQPDPIEYFDFLKWVENKNISYKLQDDTVIHPKEDTLTSDTTIPNQTLDSNMATNIWTDTNTIIKTDTTANNEQLETEPIYKTKTLTYNIEDLRKNKDPLITNTSRHSLLLMLGEQDANTIIQQYNPEIAVTKSTDFDWKWVSIFQLDSLNIPQVFPSVKDFFKPDLWEFLQDKPELQKIIYDFFEKHPATKEKFAKEKTCIIQTNLPNGKMGIAYYENGKLEIAGPTSIGDGKWYKWYHARSPQWGFYIITKNANKRNKQGDRMPYYLEFNAYNKNNNLRGLWIHWWQLVTGDPKSHGCSRFVHVLTKPLFEKVERTDTITDPWTPVFAQWNPYKRELDSVKYYQKQSDKKIQEYLERTQDDSTNIYRKKIEERFQKKK